MTRHRLWIALGLVAISQVARAQSGPSGDEPVLRAIWSEGMLRSRLDTLAFSLLDSIGPRLTGTPGLASAHRFLVDSYRRWGIDATTETYGGSPGWQRGVTHLDLITPRVRTVDARLEAYSPGLASPRTAKVLTLPRRIDSASVEAWLRDIRGNFVLLSVEPRTCRPRESWEQTTGSAGAAAMRAAADSARDIWLRQVMAVTRRLPDSLYAIIDRARPSAIFTTEWSGGWGATRVLSAHTSVVPSVSLSCEDYGLFYRLARRSSNTTARLDARAQASASVPAQNTIARIVGTDAGQSPVVLSAHLDSWDGGSGATDNGSGTLIVMEAMRILRAHYPRPRRAIIAGHWGGEEQGIVGSSAFVKEHPELADSLHVVFNQDNGTGPIREISLQGFTRVGPAVRRWLTRMPRELTDSLIVADPGNPTGASDFVPFTCRGAPAIVLGALEFDYNLYTWHTTLDTPDKLSFPSLRRNATMLAMLAYLAAEEPLPLPRDRLTESLDAATGIRIRPPRCAS